MRALRIREFASQELGLPDNAAYRSYADIGRQYVVWNVVATPEFSVRPRVVVLPHRRLRGLSRLFQAKRPRDDFAGPAEGAGR